MASSSTEYYPQIGDLARDLLTKDYNFDQRYTLALRNSPGTAITATGVVRNQFFLGDINTAYKIGNATVNVKVDTKSNVSTKLTISNILHGTKTAFSFKIPDLQSSKLDVQYRSNHAAFGSSIGLYPTLNLELTAAMGIKVLSFGGKVGFDTASASFTKYDAGIALNKADFSAALLLMNKGQTLKASYFHAVDRFHSVAADMTYRSATNKTYFTFGSSHLIDQFNTVKTRFSYNGRIAMVYQRQWMSRSLITFSVEYDTKAVNAGAYRFGLGLILRP